jgi:hypothetical protein
MAITGTPCQRPHVTVHCLVTVWIDADTFKIEHWTGTSKASIRRAAKAKYDGLKIQFGNTWTTNSYGAH